MTKDEIKAFLLEVLQAGSETTQIYVVDEAHPQYDRDKLSKGKLAIGRSLLDFEHMTNTAYAKIHDLDPPIRPYTDVAFGHEGKVFIWATGLRRLKDGGLSFYCENGGWRGTFIDGFVTVDGYPDQAPRPAEIIWRGRVPYRHQYYSDAIEWIENQLSMPDYRELHGELEETLGRDEWVSDEVPF